MPPGGILRLRADRPGSALVFCSVRCAREWVRDGGNPDELRVADEATGVEVPAASAFWVESTVYTSRATAERLHAFRRRADAEAHAASFNGVVLGGDGRPFAAAPQGEPIADR